MEGWQPELRVVGEGEAGGVVVDGRVDTQVMGLVGPFPQRAVDTLGNVVQDASVGGVTDEQHLQGTEWWGGVGLREWWWWYESSS